MPSSGDRDLDFRVNTGLLTAVQQSYINCVQTYSNLQQYSVENVVGFVSICFWYSLGQIWLWEKGNIKTCVT